MQIKPKIIESKGDVLFAANIEYVQDDVDKMFENYDTRSFSIGNYWKLTSTPSNPVTKYWWDAASCVWRETQDDITLVEYPITFTLAGSNESHGGTLDAPPAQAELCHRQFNSSDYTYNEKWWSPI
jgi:hypothetical protein